MAVNKRNAGGGSKRAGAVVCSGGEHKELWSAEDDMNAMPDASTGAERRGKGAAAPTYIRAKDVLATDFIVAPVICINPDTPVRRIAKLLAEKKISAVPVVDEKRSIVGIVSEGDLMQRLELGTELRAAAKEPGARFADASKTRGLHARDVMSSTVITVTEDASLAEIVEMMLIKQIRRVLVVQNGDLRGVVSRSDIVRVLAARPEGAGGPVSTDDDIIRFKVIETLLSIPGTSPWLGAVHVSNGVVELHGTVEEEDTLDPSFRAVGEVVGVVAVHDKRIVNQPFGA